ncbi:MAG TPA: cell division protein FtsW [Planctomycetes bacterium]|nr:cell division protein FtsW [Planctomycetota bacterium]HIJ71066.1 cell division protein FtsW [Planctomycetota bacterium]
MSSIEQNGHKGGLIEALVLVLMGIGTLFVFSAGANISIDYDLEHFYDFASLKQVLFFPLAVLVLYLCSRLDYEKFGFEVSSPAKSFLTYLLILAIVLLILVLVPGIGVQKHGARRWLDICPGPVYVSFQPSELAKWTVVFFLAAIVVRLSDTIKLYWKGFIFICLFPGLVVALIVTQDFGTSAFIVLLTFLMLLIGGAHWWHFLTPLPLTAVAFYAAIVSSPTRVNRIKSFINPAAISYQARQSLIAISTGGIWGKGLGKGICKYGHVPEDTTDFVFAIIAEELGFAGAALVIAIFIAFVVCGMIIVIRCRNRFGRLLAAGIVLTIALQAAINIGVAMVVLPTKGIPLPFLSAGGTSMLLSAAAVGVLINIAKQTDRQNKIPGS